MQFDPKSFILDDEPWNFQILSDGKIANTRPAAVGDSQLIQNLVTGADEQAVVLYINALGVTEEDRAVIAAMPVETKSIVLIGYMAYTQERLKKKSQAAANWVRTEMAAKRSTSRS